MRIHYTENGWIDAWMQEIASRFINKQDDIPEAFLTLLLQKGSIVDMSYRKKRAVNSLKVIICVTKHHFLVTKVVRQIS